MTNPETAPPQTNTSPLERAWMVRGIDNVRCNPHEEDDIAKAADTDKKVIPLIEDRSPPENQTKSVLGTVHCFEAFAPSAEPLRESVIKVRAVKGPHIGHGGLTPFFKDFGSAFIRQHRDIDMHNDLREIARARSSPSRREIGDNIEVERRSDNAMVTPSESTFNTSSKADRTAGTISL